jgi:macrodomain Ter protein organizer (MatP/YcbG family)
MATLADLEAQKDATLAAIDSQKAAALTNRNAATTEAERERWDNAADQIAKKRSKFLQKIFQAEDNSPEIQQAIDTLKAATAAMTTAAGRMTQATTFVDGLADLLGAINDAIGALK